MGKPHRFLAILLLLLLALSACHAKETPADPEVHAPTVLFTAIEERIEQDGRLLFLAQMNQPRLKMPSDADPAIEREINELLSSLCAELMACPVDRDLLLSRYESAPDRFQPVSCQITVEITCMSDSVISLLLRSETVGGGISATYDMRGITLPLVPSPAPLTLAEAFSISDEAASDRILAALRADIRQNPLLYDLADPENPPLDAVEFVIDGSDPQSGVLIFLRSGIAPGLTARLIPISYAEITHQDAP